MDDMTDIFERGPLSSDVIAVVGFGAIVLICIIIVGITGFLLKLFYKK